MIKKFIFLFFFLFSAIAFAKPIHIVAAENFYGEIAQQIGGQYVQVLSIMSNPNQDPHLFSASVATAKAIAEANVIVYSGIDYDPWMKNLIAANTEQNKKIIIVADLIHKKPGDNPHIWYDPHTMLMYAEDLTQNLIKLDVDHKQYYQQNLDNFKTNEQTLFSKMDDLRARYKNSSIIATEPVFGYMSDILGFKMSGDKFQMSIMNNTPPSAEETKNFEDKLRLHQVKLLIYNKQASNPITRRMQDIARQSGIPVVGVTETQPIDMNYVNWMLSQLENIDKALSSGSHQHD